MKINTLLFIALGLFYANFCDAQKIPRKFKKDSDIGKYLPEYKTERGSNAIYMDLISPLFFGHLNIGYQRKIHRNFYADILLKVGMGQPLIDNLSISNQLRDNSDYGNGESKYSAGKYRVGSGYRISTYWRIMGSLMDDVLGLGVYYKAQRNRMDYDIGGIADGKVVQKSWGITMNNQTRISSNLGIGWTAGVGPGIREEKNLLYSEYNGWSSPTYLTKNSSSPVADYHAELRLIYTF